MQKGPVIEPEKRDSNLLVEWDFLQRHRDAKEKRVRKELFALTAHLSKFVKRITYFQSSYTAILSST